MFKRMIGHAKTADYEPREYSSELERAPLIATDSKLLTEHAVLLKKAKDFLGYTGVTGSDVLREVQHVLDELGYDFLDAKKVREYQISKVGMDTQHSLDFHWPLIAINNYRNPIPEFALSKAVELKERFWLAEFFVQPFDDRPDPFLVMKYKGETFWVEVWEEHEFEARKIVP